MGKWFAKFLKSNGYSVIISDSNERFGKRFCRSYGIDFMDDWSAAVQRADVILLATPTNQTSSILRQLLLEISRKTLIVEISSVKGPVQDIINDIRKRNLHVLSLHPMFGPGTNSVRDRTILVMTRPRHAEAKRLLSVLQKRGARIIACPIKKHDVLVSVVIALPHLMNISLIETLRELRVNFAKVAAISGPTFKLQSILAEAIYQEDPANEISILADSKRSVLKAYAQRIATILDIIDHNPNCLVDVLDQGRRLVERDKGYKKSYEKFNAAVEVALR
jgi:prephenate dehydrogenase